MSAAVEDYVLRVCVAKRANNLVWSSVDHLVSNGNTRLKNGHPSFFQNKTSRCTKKFDFWLTGQSDGGYFEGQLSVMKGANSLTVQMLFTGEVRGSLLWGTQNHVVPLSVLLPRQHHVWRYGYCYVWWW